MAPKGYLPPSPHTPRHRIELEAGGGGSKAKQKMQVISTKKNFLTTSRPTVRIFQLYGFQARSTKLRFSGIFSLFEKRPESLKTAKTLLFLVYA